MLNPNGSWSRFDNFKILFLQEKETEKEEKPPAGTEEDTLHVSHGFDHTQLQYSRFCAAAKIVAIVTGPFLVLGVVHIAFSTAKKYEDTHEQKVLTMC